MPRRPMLAVTALAATLTLAGCGGDAITSATLTPGATLPTSAPAATPSSTVPTTPVATPKRPSDTRPVTSLPLGTLTAPPTAGQRPTATATGATTLTLTGTATGTGAPTVVCRHGRQDWDFTVTWPNGVVFVWGLSVPAGTAAAKVIDRGRVFGDTDLGRADPLGVTWAGKTMTFANFTLQGGDSTAVVNGTVTC